MKKITEGYGVISEAAGYLCINPMQPEPPQEPIERWIKWDERRIYPSAFFPDEVGNMGRLHKKVVHYKIIVEIEEVGK
jgi:hypothetical protein